MIEINLLPWRAIIRAENAKRKRSFIIFLGILAIIYTVIWTGLTFAIESYATKIASLQDQLTELTNQAQQDPINPPLVMANQIHLNQLELFHFFKIMIQEMQSNILWTAVTSKNNNLIIEGDVDSWEILVNFVNTYNLSHTILPITILSARKKDADSSLHFYLQYTRAILPFLNQAKNDAGF